MKLRRLISIPIVMFLCLTLLPIPAKADNTYTEMDILEMFYTEDDLVVSSTRHPKSLSKVAENISVITAEEIEAMNVHTVAEVLTQVPGLYVSFQGRDFGSDSLLRIQGSNDFQVLVLVDGVKMNYLGGGNPSTNNIPLGLISRIEVIKGPASSAWGSSLGGVVNIITKQASSIEEPGGSIKILAGKNNTTDIQGELVGEEFGISYYLYAGRQQTDGLRDERFFENDSFYSKISKDVGEKSIITASFFASSPELLEGKREDYDLISTAEHPTIWGKAQLDGEISDSIKYNLSLYKFSQKLDQEMNSLGIGLEGLPTSKVFVDSTISTDEVTGGSGQVVLNGGDHVLVTGFDYEFQKLTEEYKVDYEWDGVKNIYNPISSTYDTDNNIFALFINDTVTIDRFTITPGLRYDYNEIYGSFISPSLGTTIRIGEDSLFRFAVARGFSSPPLGWLDGSNYSFTPNPELEPETVWSYQMGVESNIIEYLWYKATVFRHDTEDSFVDTNSNPKNKGELKRDGLEFEIRSVPVFGFSAECGASFTNIDDSNNDETTRRDTYNARLKYKYGDDLSVMLFGSKVYTDGGNDAEYDCIWDISIEKAVLVKDKTSVKLIVAGHNLFDGKQYTAEDNQNPDRWYEFGLRCVF